MRISSDLAKIINGDLPLDFNWNSDPHPDSPLPKTIPSEPTVQQLKKIIIDDEGLRDGLHGVPDYPGVEDMERYIAAAYDLGIEVMTVGIYSGSGVVDKSTKNILKILDSDYPKIIPIVLSLASEDSLKWSADCADINPRLQVLVFMGSAPSRMLVEGWTKKYVLEKLGWAIDRAVRKYQLTVIGATEHTTQTPPDFLRKIIRTQIENGARYFCIADTIGTARPRGVYRLVKFVKKVLKEIGVKDILIDWHGHRDLGLSITNTLTAVATGVNRIHLVAWGIGERSGNTSLEKFLINHEQILEEHGFKSKWDLAKLSNLLNIYAEITNNQMPSYGCLSHGAFFTSLGIHTAAILKAEKLAQEAEKKGHANLVPRLKAMARKVYAGFDPLIVGRNYQIGISPYSGGSTVKLWSITHGLSEPSERTIKKILMTTKELRRSLTEEEILRLLNSKI